MTIYTSTPATLEDISDALFDALATLNPAAAQGTPGTATGTATLSAVKYIGRWIGDPLRASGQPDQVRNAIATEVNGRTPAVLLAFEGEQDEGGLKSLIGEAEVVGTSSWVVLVVMRDTSGTRPTTLTTGGRAGALTIANAVQGVLTNLVIDGLYRTTRVRYLDTRVFFAVPGEIYALAVRFSARRALTNAELDTSELYPFFELGANVNLIPQDLAGDFYDSNPIDPLGVVVSAGPFPPSPLDPPTTALLARFRAGAVNGLDADGTARRLPTEGARVPMWRDAHSGRWTLFQATGSAQPVFDASAINSQAAVIFGAASDMTAAIEGLPLAREARTLVVIGASWDASAEDTEYIAGWGNAATALGAFYACTSVHGAGGAFQLYTGGAAGATSTGVVTGASAVMLEFSYDAPTAVLRVSPTAGAVTTASATMTLATADATRVGLRVGRTSGVFALAELLVYTRVLTAAERTTLRAYASRVYAINGA